MNIIERGRKALAAFVSSNDDEVVLANGLIADKKDVDDPTGKFSGIHHVSTFYKTERLKRNVEFYKPEYDLPTIANAVMMDGILQRATNVYVEQILKNGYEFTSKNDRLQKHVIRRIKEIQNLTGISFYETMNYISKQLVTYGNCYIIKVRSASKCEYGRPFRLYGKNMDPVVGLFVADATTIEIGVNKDGQVVNYRQIIRGEETYWDERDVIHLTYNKIPGTLTGMSSVIPILDDIRALRKLEEEIEILGFQYSIPLYLYKVGTKEQPPAPNEIEQVTSTVNHMPAYGMLVVPGHHTIEVPTNNNTPVDLISFIDHFKKRIYSGLGVSPIAMGEIECYDEDTLTLTESGWKKYTEIDKDVDKIATYNPETRGLEYHVPNLEHIRDYNGKMIHFTGKDVDIKVTPNHEMWIMIRHSGERKKVFAHELLEEKYPEFCFINKITERKEEPNSEVVNLDGKSICEFALVQLAGWYVSSGYLDAYNASQGRYRTIISQKEYKVTDIRNLLDNLDLSYSEQLDQRTGVINFRIYGKELYDFMKDNFGQDSNNKFLSKKFKVLSTRLARSLVRAMMDGNGSWEDNNTGIYFTTSNRLRNDFMQLSLTAGYQTRALGSYFGSYSGSSLPIHRISITDSDEDYIILTPDNVEEVDYNGKVYCYNVPNHLFITMRNGKVAIQGNTSNRNTAEVLDLAMQTITKRYQQIIKHGLEMELIREFMLDGGFDTIREELSFNFPEIDLENQIKKENNIIQKWQNNLISRTEARIELDYEKTIEEDDTFLQNITIPEINAKIGAKINDLAIGKSSSSDRAKNSTANATRPSNQYGTLSGRPKITRDFLAEIEDSVSEKINNMLLYNGYESSLNVSTLADRLSSDIKLKLKEQINYNLKQIREFYHVDSSELDTKAIDLYLDDVEYLIKDKVLRVGRRASDEIKVGVITNDIKKFIDFQKRKALNLSKILIYKSLGYKTILVEAKECLDHVPTNISSNDLSYGRIPPFRYNCKCSVDEESLYEFQEQQIFTR